MNRHSIVTAVFTPGLLALAVTAKAQPTVEEIIITADFRQQNLDAMPASVTVLDAQLIASKNALHLEDILQNAPNVNFASGASRARFYQIRGIGERSNYAEPLNSSVGLLIDGVDFSGIGGAAMLYDMEQVEILLGPQGTRYGSNALAGLINLQSKMPAEQTQYGLQLQHENHDGAGVAAYVSGALTPALLGRLSVQQVESDGFYTNLTLGKPTNTRDESIVRGKLQWLLSDQVTADLTLSHIDIDNGYDAFSLDNNRDILSDEPGFDRQQSDLASFKLSSAVFETFSFEVIAGLANSNIGYGYDEDWAFIGFHPDEYSSTDFYFRDHSTLSAELRALSNESSLLFNGSTSWITGLYVLDQQVDLERVYTYLPTPFNSTWDMARTAFYAETSTTLGQSLTLETGLRIENAVASYKDNEGVSFYPSEVLTGGKLALTYRTSNNSLLYTSASRGYKTGGFNTDGTLDADLREFGAETLWNYEVGFKGSLLRDQLQTRIALFYMDRADVQINSSTTRVRSDGSAEFIAYTGNAAAGFNRGLELSAEWVADGRVTLYGNLGLLDSEYENFINSEGNNLDGRQQAHAPDYQYTLGTNIFLLPQLSLDLNIQGRDAFYFSDSHAVRSPAYNLLNASLLWEHQGEGKRAQVRLWGRNLLDKDYFVRGFYFGNDPRIGYDNRGYTQLGEPLRYGLTINLDF